MLLWPKGQAILPLVLLSSSVSVFNPQRAYKPCVIYSNPSPAKISKALVTSCIRAVSVARSGNIRIHHAVLLILLTLFTAPCFAEKVRSVTNKQSSPYYKTALMSSSADDALNPAAFSGHVPVLFRETLELLSPRAGAKLLDGTFGGGEIWL